MRLKTKTSVNTSAKYLWVALGIIGVSMLPYLHDLLPFLPEGDIFGYSSWKAFLWSTSMYVFSHLGWLFAYYLAKGKPYRFAILTPVFFSLYRIIIIFTNSRGSAILNGVSTKLFIALIFSLLLIVNFFKNNRNEAI